MTLATGQPLRFQPPAQPAQGTGRRQVKDIAALFELPFTELLWQLANLAPDYPESVPVNHLVRVQGTPLADLPPLDPIEFVRVIAVARITMPRTKVRLSAGRREMSEAVQALCFAAGANSIFYGDKLLTTGNPDVANDLALLEKLGMRAQPAG